MDSEDNFEAAKLEELANWSAMNVYDRVEDHGQHTVGTRWVLTDRNGVLKARLVAKGFEDQSDTSNPLFAAKNLLDDLSQSSQCFLSDSDVLDVCCLSAR